MEERPEEEMAFNKKKKAENTEETVNEAAENTQEEIKTEETAKEAPEAQPEVSTEDLIAAVATLQAQAEANAQKAEEYLNMAQRVQADFDNFRRRNANVRADAFEDGAREFIKTLLPVMDNLERALMTESQDAALKQGVEMVFKQLSDTLTKRGVTVIDRKGEKFDPNLENAVMQGTADEGEPGTVCVVLQKGYKLGDIVLRHAMVKVVAE